MYRSARLFNADATFYRNCFDAFKDMDVEVIMSIGSNVSEASLGQPPPNFSVRTYVPQLEVLRRASAFVTHGGMNSVSESLYYGVPLVVIPQMSEQEMVGRRVEELGAGLYLAKQEATPARLRESVERVLAEGRFREQAAVVRQSFHAAGGAARAADAVLAFTGRGGDIVDRMIRRVIVAAVCLLAVPSTVRTQSRAPIRGFTAADTDVQRQVEEKFRAVPKPENNREYMRTITAEPHHAGSPGSRKVAEYVLAQFKSWGLNASIETFDALMPYPTERVVELVAPEHYTLKLAEPPVPQDPDSTDAGALPTFNAYSADGDVTADLVYVNFGTPEDYEQLAKLGVDVKGKIVIARYGRSWRGIKPKVAYEHGAVGCIIYSDPHEDGFFQGDVFPQGPYRPEMGAQRGSVMDMPINPGDPLTPGIASEPGATRLDRSKAPTILKIPVLPISYGDALPLLRALTGPVAPEGWRGALPITYHVGAGPAKVHLKLAFDWSTRPLYDVIVRIDGSEFPDEWIIHGNHHDAWVNGAADPTSGNVALMETARGLGELLKAGWRPKRTIILASWDGEEWGLLGSTEWVEKHAQELSAKAVAYINSDSTSKGWLDVVRLAFAPGLRQRADAGSPGSQAREEEPLRRQGRSRARPGQDRPRRRPPSTAAATSRSRRSARDRTTPRSSIT